jgi:outer membrane protein assembly factor BamB
VWKNAEVTMYTVSPVFADGTIYGMSNKRRGQFVALDAGTGALKWATQGRDGNHASIQQTAQHLLLLTDGGTLIVARRTPESFVEERRYELGQSATWAQPVFLADGLLVREATGIVKLLWE